MDEGEREQGRTGDRRGEPGGVREGPEGQSLQGLEPDVVGRVLPAPGDGGGDTEAAWRRDPRARGALRRGQDRADRGGGPAGAGGGAGVLPGFLRVPAAPGCAGRGGGMPGALLEVDRKSTRLN